jgi:hypothetical protein
MEDDVHDPRRRLEAEIGHPRAGCRVQQSKKERQTTPLLDGRRNRRYAGNQRRRTTLARWAVARLARKPAGRPGLFGGLLVHVVQGTGAVAATRLSLGRREASARKRCQRRGEKQHSPARARSHRKAIGPNVRASAKGCCGVLRSPKQKGSGLKANPGYIFWRWFATAFLEFWTTSGETFHPGQTDGSG